MVTGRQLDRREFLAAAGTGTLIVAVGAQGCSRVDEDLRGVERKPTLTITPLAHVRLDDTGTVTVVCHRSEMGQGIRTTMAMVIADELEADWERVVVEQAPGDEKVYGSQNTDGSTSIRDFLPKYRETGATVVDDLYGDSLGPHNSEGATYIGMMRSNTEKITEALKQC